MQVGSNSQHTQQNTTATFPNQHRLSQQPLSGEHLAKSMSVLSDKKESIDVNDNKIELSDMLGTIKAVVKKQKQDISSVTDDSSSRVGDFRFRVNHGTDESRPSELCTEGNWDDNGMIAESPNKYAKSDKGPIPAVIERTKWTTGAITKPKPESNDNEEDIEVEDDKSTSGNERKDSKQLPPCFRSPPPDARSRFSLFSQVQSPYRAGHVREQNYQPHSGFRSGPGFPYLPPSFGYDPRGRESRMMPPMFGLPGPYQPLSLMTNYPGQYTVPPPPNLRSPTWRQTATSQHSPTNYMPPPNLRRPTWRDFATLQQSPPNHLMPPDHVTPPNHATPPNHLMPPNHVAPPNHLMPPKHVTPPKHVMPPNYVIPPNDSEKENEKQIASNKTKRGMSDCVPEMPNSSVTDKGRMRLVSYDSSDETSNSDIKIQPFAIDSLEKTKHITTTGIDPFVDGVRAFQPNPFTSPAYVHQYSGRRHGRRSRFSNGNQDSDSDSPRVGKSRWKTEFREFHSYGVKYIDTHCHLDFIFNREGFKGNFEDYMEKHPETFPDEFEGCVAVFCNPASFKPTGTLFLII